MRNLIFGLVILTVSTSGFARCDYPKQIKPESLPNGEIATKAEMIDGQKLIKSYLGEMNSFLDCLESEEQAAAEDPERLAIVGARHNAAVEEMEKTAELFNVAVRTYKTRADQ